MPTWRNVQSRSSASCHVLYCQFFFLQYSATSLIADQSSSSITTSPSSSIPLSISTSIGPRKGSTSTPQGLLDGWPAISSSSSIHIGMFSSTCAKAFAWRRLSGSPSVCRYISVISRAFSTHSGKLSLRTLFTISSIVYPLCCRLTI
ncbi:hypothetical protein ES703_31072 [subsurface metagenome]